jgi:hypothetical protein
MHAFNKIRRKSKNDNQQDYLLKQSPIHTRLL